MELIRNGMVLVIVVLTILPTLVGGCDGIRNASVVYQITRLQILEDVSFSSFKELQGVQFREIVLQPAIRSLTSGTSLFFIPLDGSMRANPQILYSDQVAIAGGINDAAIRLSRIRIAKALIVGHDSLVATRNRSFRSRTELFHGFKFASSPGFRRGRTVMLICSDMIEDSPLCNMSRPFDAIRLGIELSRFSLMPDLSGTIVVIVTPPASMADTNLYLSRKAFWSGYFKASGARLFWFGSDWVSASRFLRELLSEGNS